ncbi:MAG TPA: BrnA antitoxin family protein, partial [Bryobacteraceae bacterium]|nr:BrnA antitoxin family protein [Bryobacteraceae bacterium]
YYDFSKGKRGAVIPLPPGQELISIRLDRDVIDYFLDRVDRAGGGDYQTDINNVLRAYIEGRRATPELEETLRRVIREELHPEARSSS